MADSRNDFAGDFRGPARPSGDGSPHGLHPHDAYLRPGRIPHIWCDGCGLGTSLTGFIEGVLRSGIPWERVAVVSGIGCTGRAAGYLSLDGYHTTHGRPIPFATGLSLAKPDMRVVVYSGDGDLFAIGGNHFIHAARRNADLLVYCVNNFNYAMTGGQMGPTTPGGAWTSTSPAGHVEKPFNLVHMAVAAGATYVARWTTLHVRQLMEGVSEAMGMRGFRFIEVISPCPTCFGRKNDLGRGLDTMKAYRDRTTILHGADPADGAIGLDGRFVVGTFLNAPRPTFGELYGAMASGAAPAAGGEE
ncbi:MAG: 2-oxoacid:ferredoxin oxidoreductase subunit beta [Planctomycetaceae bacterium]|nr:2-oxoacid:ferredoxin oxidoreductase subunit beta [Planctomycetaceae bacterium]